MSPAAVPPEPAPPLLDAGRTYWVATAVGYLINPLVLPAILLGLVQANFGAPAAEIQRTVWISLACFGFVPLGFLAWLLHRRRIASLEVRHRSRRTAPLVVGLSAALVALLLLQVTTSTARPLVTAIAGTIVLNGFLTLLITLRWKISIHASALAGTITVLLFIAQAPWHSLPLSAILLTPERVSWLFLLLGLVMWARVRAGAHTIAQVVGGAAFGLVLPYIEFMVLAQAGAFAGLQ